ncbi:L,D-transpeptidase family protein [Sandaracinobacteroides hominis]|uniref:L,D-transpeptidase family protein n=1 Tax=Sandaracinobacteroides hominis TaxID=2780086 RepID=UPI0018F4ADDF|nr:L,D-transpeptidase family protein [Sandaracinobacteroides hominis]
MIRLDVSTATLHAFGNSYRAAIGRGGAVPASAKREGDGATPIGTWRLQGALFRPDRISAPETSLPWRWLRPADGWSDDIHDPGYNRPITHPHAFSAERLWREDNAYDIILLLDHNSHPPVPGAGSAIFWHLAQPDWRPTEGCIAIDREAMLEILPRLEAGQQLAVETPPRPA